jgi:glycosyltransferase involved in cell wall biosynthesis
MPTEIDNNNMFQGAPFADRKPERKYRLFFCSSCDGWGGSEELWSGSARNLAESGHHILVSKHNVDYENQRIVSLLEAGATVEDYNIEPRIRMRFLRSAANRVLPRKMHFRFHGRQQETYVKRLYGTKYDLGVVSQGENFDGLGFVRICQRVGLPYVLVVQKVSCHTWPVDEIRSAMHEAYINARRVYFVSEHNRTLTEWQIGHRLENAEVIRNPFVTGFTDPIPYPEPIEGKFRLACVARMWVVDKGQDILLAVLAKEKWKQRNLEVSFFGEGVNRGAVEGMAKLFDLSSVKFCGFTHNIPEVWKEHHALVLASRAEGLPLVLVEAMLCGRTSIVTNVGGCAEVVEEGKTGFIAEFPDVDALDAAMERAWSSRQEWGQMGSQASLSIRTKVSSDPCGVFASKLEDLCSSLRQENREPEYQRELSSISQPIHDKF